MTIARLALIILIHLPYVCYGDCNPKDWSKNVLKDGRYFLLSKRRSHFRTAQTFCEDQGGQLVTFRSEKDHQRITEWTRSRGGTCDDRVFIGLGRPVFLGLGRPVDDVQNFRWVDGRPMDNTTYRNWAEGHPQGQEKECVSTSYCSKPKWKSEFCFHEKRAICESFDPCSSRVVISVNGIRRWHGKEVILPLDEEAEIECALRGSSRSTAKIDIMISCGPNHETVRATELSRVFFIGGDMEKKTCSCQPQSQQTWMPSEITVRIFASPSLVGGKPNKPLIISKEGEKAVLDFDVLSVPKPISFSLYKDTDELGSRWYSVNMDSVEGHPLHTRITLVIKNLQTILTGPYKLIVSNRIKEDLKVTFFLKVERLEPPEVSPKIIVGVLTIIFILATLVCAFAGSRWMNRRRRPDDLFNLYRQSVVAKNRARLAAKRVS